MLRLVPGPGDVADRRAGEALQDLLAPMFEGREGEELDRYRRFDADLRACIEARGAQHLVGDERMLLELERSVDPAGAVARTAPASVLLLVLPTFLEEPAWQGNDDVDRKLRMRLGVALARWIVDLPELADVDADDEMADVLDAWRAARRRLRTDQQRRDWQTMDARARATMEDLFANIGIPSPMVEFGLRPAGGEAAVGLSGPSRRRRSGPTLPA